MTGKWKHWPPLRWFGTSILFTLLLVCAITAQENSERFVFRVRMVADEAPALGPIPLKLTLKNAGQQTVKITPLTSGLEELSVYGPKSWVRREEQLTILTGVYPQVRIEAGESVSRMLYLHEFFEEIHPGKAEVKIVLKIRPEKKVVTLRDTVSLTITDDDSRSFSRRLKRIEQRIAAEEDISDRLKLYESILHLSHSEVMPLLLRGLRNPDVHSSEFRWAAINRLIDICERTGEWNRVVEYLSVHGERLDRQFFAYWKEERVKLSSKQLHSLNSATNCWIRLYAATLPGQPNPQILIGALRSEVNALREEIAAAEKTIGGKRQ